MLCKKCGAQIDDNAKECNFCGEKFVVDDEIIEETHEAETQAEVVEEERSTHEILEENERKRKAQKEQKEQTEEVVVDEKEQQLSEINERRELKKKKERKWKDTTRKEHRLQRQKSIAKIATGYYLATDILLLN